LYTGPNAIQHGVAPGTITDERVTALRGVVRTTSLAPIAGVHVTAVGHPEYGETLTRSDGAWDFAINGGGAITLQFAKNGYLTAQRLVPSQWHDWKPLDDVVLAAYDSAVTTIAMNAAAPQVARASTVNDKDGTRRATLLFPVGATATLKMPDGSSQAVASLNVRATELTVGPTGPHAMPAPLPATSGYTYCVELSADEATAAGATSVDFSAPVAFYVDNFLNLPAGTVVPVGYYDRQRAAWMASDNGVVMKILAVSNGVAILDTNGDGAPDDQTRLAATGIGEAEQRQLATLYSAGQTLWRSAAKHFTPFDHNYPGFLPPGAVSPNQPQATWFPAPESKASCALDTTQNNYSIVECANQTLGEAIDVAGTPYRLEYVSSRAARTKYKMTIHLTGATLPPPLQKVQLSVVIAGKATRLSFPPQPNLDYTLAWDANDAFGRAVQGAQAAYISIGYEYPLMIERPTGDALAWARPGDGTSPIGTAREPIVLSQTYQLQLGHAGSQSTGFGGWTFNAQQFYDGQGKTIYESGGTQRAGDPQQNGQSAISTVAGNGKYDAPAVPGVATATPLNFVWMVATAPDGSSYLADADHMIWRVKDGVMSEVSGKYNQRGFTPDGQPALGAKLRPWDVAVGPDGSVFINDWGNGRIRKIVDGLLVTVAGNGGFGLTPNIDGKKATEITIDPQGIAVGPDNSLYIADQGRVIRVGPDGIATKIAGAATGNWPSPDGVATATVVVPLAVAVGPDGSVYMADSAVVRRITPEGMIRTIAGSYDTTKPVVQDGQPANSGKLYARPGTGGTAITWGLSVAADGTLIICDPDGAKVFAVSTNGILTTLAGTGGHSYDIPANGQLARGSYVDFPWDAKVAPDGGLLIADFDLNIVRKTASMFPSYRPAGLIVPAQDG
ncbi:MAG TPA: hypothetical protein VEO74_03125, partial [Thermoanaerobaculia bacterium]|nr:hypothetical protein [Thermoanaerobaculia bacterium]